MFDLKTYKGVMFDTTEFIDAKFEGKLTFVFKDDMRNLRNFH